MIDTWILCYLSEVVVLKLASAVLYLECMPLDMRTSAPEWDAGRIGRRQRFAAEYGCSLASDYESTARMSRRQEVSSYRAFELDRRVCVCVPQKYVKSSVQRN